MYSADSFSERFSRHALRQHSLISAPVQPSSFGRSSSRFHFAREIFQIASRSSADGRSKKNVPNVNRRRNSGGRLVIELHVAIHRLFPWEIASKTCSAARRRSPEPPTSELCIAERSN